MNWKNIVFFSGLLILATGVGGILGGMVRGIYTANGLPITIWVTLFQGFTIQGAALLVAIYFGKTQRNKIIQHLGVLFIIAIILTLFFNVLLLERAAMESIIGSTALGIILALGTGIGTELRLREEDQQKSGLVNHRRIARLISLSVSALAIILTANFVISKLSMPLKQMLELEPYLLPAVEQVKAIDSETYIELSTVLDSVNFYGNRGLMKADYLQIIRISFPVIYCASDIQKSCFGVDMRECRMMIAKALDYCIDMQSEVVPDYIGFGSDGIQIGTAIGECAGGMYGDYYDEGQEATMQCQQALQTARENF